MDVGELIQTLGFPAAVAAFALFNSYKHEEFLQQTLETTLKENTEAITQLKTVITHLMGGDGK